MRVFISEEGVLISRLGAAPNRLLPTPSVWVDSNPCALYTPWIWRLVRCSSALRLAPFSNLARRYRSGDAVLNSARTERWPSGRRRTPGKCVYGNVSRVRIPPSPPFLNFGKFKNGDSAIPRNRRVDHRLGRTRADSHRSYPIQRHKRHKWHRTKWGRIGSRALGWCGTYILKLYQGLKGIRGRVTRVPSIFTKGIC